jgi:hypothetical protein
LESGLISRNSGLNSYASWYQIPDWHTAIDQGFAEASFPGAARRGAEILAAQASKNQVLPWEVACLYLYAGDKGQALDWLERAYEERDATK